MEYGYPISSISHIIHHFVIYDHIVITRYLLISKIKGKYYLMYIVHAK